VVIKQNVLGVVFGIVSFAENCSDIASYALTDRTSIYQIDFENKSLQFICSLNIRAYGGASTFEFFASAPISIQNVEEVIPSCVGGDGTVIIEATGGTGELRYSIDGLNFQDHGTFDNLSEGNYSIIISDENNCTVIYEAVFPLGDYFQGVTIESNHASCGEADGSILISPSEDSIFLEISFDGNPFQNDLSFNALVNGDYELTLLNEEGCQLDSLVTIGQINCPIYIPNAFSPNNDNINDFFKIYPHPGFMGQLNTLGIYNRWGALMYQVDNFDSESTGWDGTFKGQVLEVGVYVYFVDLVHDDGTKEVIKGNVTLMR